ncbi:hypothetical protein IFM89_012507 [Coptis chinensis]|uniref:Protein kinase domain-containing protein n=1 Tax=Coptis chinensis TaxID=261450 RepID=A0A835LXW5_9MAGN|nr:hypothetical protein IFM89_012507 [Coptis chinensis]
MAFITLKNEMGILVNSLCMSRRWNHVATAVSAPLGTSMMSHGNVFLLPENDKNLEMHSFEFGNNIGSMELMAVPKRKYKMSEPINKEWMSEKERGGTVYSMGVEVFLKFPKWKLGGKKCPCPCKKCRNRYWLTYKDVEHHLVSNGIEKSYCVWTLHGEDLSNIAVHPPVVANIGETTIGDVAIEMEGAEEETIGEVGIGMGNFVDFSFGLHERVVDTTIRKMLATLDDPFTRFLKPEKFKSLWSSTQGALTGVGLSIGYPTVIDESSTGLVVISSTPGTPASRAGIAKIWLKKGVIVYICDSHGVLDIYEADGSDAIATSEPLAVMFLLLPVHGKSWTSVADQAGNEIINIQLRYKHRDGEQSCYALGTNMGHKGLWSTVDGKDPQIARFAPSLNFALDIARVMECLHSNGIIHRDLKPGNVFVNEDQTKLCSTTPLLRGEKKHYDHKVDIYSFSILLTNLTPFKGMTSIQAAVASRSNKYMMMSMAGNGGMNGSNIGNVRNGGAASISAAATAIDHTRFPR